MELKRCWKKNREVGGKTDGIQRGDRKWKWWWETERGVDAWAWNKKFPGSRFKKLPQPPSHKIERHHLLCLREVWPLISGPWGSCLKQASEAAIALHISWLLWSIIHLYPNSMLSSTFWKEEEKCLIKFSLLQIQPLLSKLGHGIDPCIENIAA